MDDSGEARADESLAAEEGGVDPRFLERPADEARVETDGEGNEEAKERLSPVNAEPRAVAVVVGLAHKRDSLERVLAPVVKLHVCD